jgi:aromatic amino acid aminotransferase I / 2-aminoadipate transaminase
LHLESHPSFSTIGYKALEEELWTQIAEAGVLFGPGNIFSATPVTDDTEGDAHFRISFSNLEVGVFSIDDILLNRLQFDQMKKAVSIFAEVFEKFMKGTYKTHRAW